MLLKIHWHCLRGLNIHFLQLFCVMKNEPWLVFTYVVFQPFLCNNIKIFENLYVIHVKSAARTAISWYTRLMFRISSLSILYDLIFPSLPSDSNPCFPNPCENDAVCEVIPGTNCSQIDCFCPMCYTGDRCQESKFLLKPLFMLPCGVSPFSFSAGKNIIYQNLHFLLTQSIH